MFSKHISFFLEAAQCLNFTEAAKRMYVSQQAMTWHIAALEKELNLTLFVRSTRSVQLTPVGIYLRDQFSRLSDEMNLIVERAKKMSTEQLSRLSLGFYHGLSRQRIIIPILTALRQQCPDTFFDVQVLDMTTLRNRLLDSKVDLGITMTDAGTAWPGMQTTVLRSYPFGIYLAKDHPLLEGGFSPEKLRAISYLTTERPGALLGEGRRQARPSWLQNLPCRDTLFLPDMDTLMVYVESRRGFTCLTDNLQALDGNARLVRLELPAPGGFSQMICAYPENTPNPLAGSMADLCREALKE